VRPQAGSGSCGYTLRRRVYAVDIAAWCRLDGTSRDPCAVACTPCLVIGHRCYAGLYPCFPRATVSSVAACLLNLIDSSLEPHASWTACCNPAIKRNEQLSRALCRDAALLWSGNDVVEHVHADASSIWIAVAEDAPQLTQIDMHVSVSSHLNDTMAATAERVVMDAPWPTLEGPDSDGICMRLATSCVTLCKGGRLCPDRAGKRSAQGL
jgi:hypothetical protein